MALSKDEQKKHRQQAQKRYYDNNKEKRFRASMKSRTKRFIKSFATNEELLELKNLIENILKK